MKQCLMLAAVFLLAASISFVLERRTAWGARETSQVTAPTSSETASVGKENATEVIVPFTWAVLESTNYAQYVANLRSIRCPERVITDMLRADLTRAFAPKYSAIARQSTVSKGPTAEADKARQRHELEQEVEATLYDRLQLQRPIRSAGVLFNAVQEEKIAEARKLYPPIHEDPTNPESTALSRSNYTARIEMLSTFLNREQLQYYKLDREGGAIRVQQLLQGMQPTKEEFLKVAEALDGPDTKAFDSAKDSSTVLQGALSPERFSQWQELQRPEYQALFTFGPVRSLSPDELSALVTLRRDVFTNAPERYRQQVMAILKPNSLAEAYLRNNRIHPVQNPTAQP